MANNGSSFTIRPLTKGDPKSPFLLSDEADLPLKVFFRKAAEKSGGTFVTKTYVAVPADERDRRILGYVSIMRAEVELEGSYSLPDKPRAARYRFQPGIRIARLAVADDARGIQIGSNLVSLVLSVGLDRIVPFVGCRFIIVEAKRKSMGFYRRLGFTLLEVEQNSLLRPPSCGST